MPAPKGNKFAQEANIGNKNAQKPEDESKAKYLNIRITSEQQTKLKEMAKEAGFSKVSSFVLDRLGV